MIPKKLVRVVPETTTDEVETWWERACALHRGWLYFTVRDPLNPRDYPLTSDLWATCQTGAQLADLIRIEWLLKHGGIYLDSDVEVHKPFTPLLGLDGFAAYEDERHIPNAVMGFKAGHPALTKVLHGARQRHKRGTWEAGVGVTTEVFANRDDMLILPPGSFYPYHYSVKADYATAEARRATVQPWTFASHHWRHSWA